MTISASFKRFWPVDRLERLKALQLNARKARLRLIARNGGDRRVFLSHLAFWKDGDRLVTSFWDIGEAERWLEENGK